MEVDLRELLGNQMQQVGFIKVVDLKVKLEAFEDVSHRWAEGLDVGPQVLADVVRITHQDTLPLAGPGL